jgi:hypothetical protein
MTREMNKNKPMLRSLYAEELPAIVSINDIIDSMIHGDCLDILRRFPSRSVDMVFIDPPYFPQLPRGKNLLDGMLEQLLRALRRSGTSLDPGGSIMAL